MDFTHHFGTSIFRTVIFICIHLYAESAKVSGFVGNGIWNSSACLFLRWR